MQFIDLQTQRARIQKNVDRRFAEIFNHGRYVMGPEIDEVEQALANYVGTKHCISCSSGTDALLMPLLAWGIGPGDAVFTTTFTFIATAEVINLVGAAPVFVDIDPTTYNLDPGLLAEAVERTIADGKLTPKAIIPVDLFGLPADYDRIQSIADQFDLKVLEDAAQALGGRIGSRSAGSFGDAAGTSFFPAKPLGCYGDGGAMFTNDDELAEVLKSIRNHGVGPDRYKHVRIGLNGRMDTLQAAIILEKLTIFPDEVERRQVVAERYGKALSGRFVTPAVPEDYHSIWAQYCLLADSSEAREAHMDRLKAHAIPSAIYYPIPLHQQRAFRNSPSAEGSFPVSENVSRRIFALPMHPYLEQSDIDLIASHLL